MPRSLFTRCSQPVLHALILLMALHKFTLWGLSLVVCFFDLSKTRSNVLMLSTFLLGCSICVNSNNCLSAAFCCVVLGEICWIPENIREIRKLFFFFLWHALQARVLFAVDVLVCSVAPSRLHWQDHTWTEPFWLKSFGQVFESWRSHLPGCWQTSLFLTADCTQSPS